MSVVGARTDLLDFDDATLLSSSSRPSRRPSRPAPVCLAPVRPPPTVRLTMLPWRPPHAFSEGTTAFQESPSNPSFRSPSSHPPEMMRTSQEPPAAPLQPPPPAASPAPVVGYPPVTLASTLFFLQSEHRRYNRDRNEWEIERAEMRARLALLEGEKRGNEGALRDLGRRCKMLEAALRSERSKFLTTTNANLANLASHSPSPSGTSSPLQNPSATLAGPVVASGIPPLTKALLSQKDGTASPPAEAASAAMTPSNPSVGTIPAPSRAGSAASGTNGNGSIGGGATGTAALSSGQAAGARDPRGRARSRDYLKQCLQEITYLTSSSTLNPLSSASYAAPSLSRPRKTLADYVSPTVSVPSGSASQPPSLATTHQPGVLTLNSGIARSDGAGTGGTNYPSDPASVFVPLKRQVSLQGTRGTSIRELEPEHEREIALESGPTTTSMMATKAPTPAPIPAPSPSAPPSFVVGGTSGSGNAIFNVSAPMLENSNLEPKGDGRASPQMGPPTAGKPLFVSSRLVDTSLPPNLPLLPSAASPFDSTAPAVPVKTAGEPVPSGLTWEAEDGSLSDQEPGTAGQEVSKSPEAEGGKGEQR